ncbi:MAG: hypothetical protein NVS3B5_09780 [Sphingomicrobium sp.]
MDGPDAVRTLQTAASGERSAEVISDGWADVIVIPSSEHFAAGKPRGPCRHETERAAPWYPISVIALIGLVSILDRSSIAAMVSDIKGAPWTTHRSA